MNRIEFGSQDARIQFRIDYNNMRIDKMASTNFNDVPLSRIEFVLTSFWKRVGKRPFFTIEDYGWKLCVSDRFKKDGIYAELPGVFFVEVL